MTDERAEPHATDATRRHAARRDTASTNRADEAAPRPPILVLGVGSELRSDDAVGRRVADAVAERRLLGVEVRSVHQLTPEIAADMVGRRLVVLVDACLEVDRITVTRVDASHTAAVVSHHVDLGGLIAMSELLGGAPAMVASVALPARDLDLGLSLSAEATRAILPAVDRVVALAEGALPADLTGL